MLQIMKEQWFDMEEIENGWIVSFQLFDEKLNFIYQSGKNNFLNIKICIED